MSAEPLTPGPAVTRLAETVLPTRHGVFTMTAYRDDAGTEHVALSMGLGDPAPASGPGPAPLVRVHSECLTGDALGSHRCDCGDQLQQALAQVAEEGRGAVVYLRGHEGRGIGLVEKVRAYALQDAGVDTVEANLRLGHPADARSYDHCALILEDLGLRRVRLLTSNPAKEEALLALGVEVVGRQGLSVPVYPENARYLRTKRERMGHDDAVQDDADGTSLDEATGGPAPARYADLTAPDGPRVIAQLGQSLDGYIATRTGDATFVTGEQDRTHLHRLRSLVDAVVVGAATAVADDPQLTVRAVTGTNPVRVVLDPRGLLPAAARVLTDGAAPTLWVLGAGARPAADLDDLAEHVTVLRWETEGPMDPAQVLARLRGRGIDRVLVEGGGRLVSAWVGAGEVDRVYLTTAPVLIGDGVPGLRAPSVDRLCDAARPVVLDRWHLGDDTVTVLAPPR